MNSEMRRERDIVTKVNEIARNALKPKKERSLHDDIHEDNDDNNIKSKLSKKVRSLFNLEIYF